MGEHIHVLVKAVIFLFIYSELLCKQTDIDPSPLQRNEFYLITMSRESEAISSLWNFWHFIIEFETCGQFCF